MSDIQRMTITLTAQMARAVKGAVGAGDYASSSEVIREALRDWQHKRRSLEGALEQLRSQIGSGLDDIDAGRVRDFDADRIIEEGPRRSASGEHSG